MATDTNVNGGTKLVTAGLLMTLGVGGALLFRQDPAVTARSESPAGELLVRRSNAPLAGPFEPPVPPRDPQPTDASSLTSAGGAAQFSGGIDPFRNEGARAATQARLTAEYGRPATPLGVSSTPATPASAPYAPSYLFVDPMSESERTPLNNMTSRIELPAEYPGSRRPENAATSSTAGSPTGSPGSSPTGMSPVGSLQGASSNSAASIRPPFMNAATGLGGNAGLAPRTVMPTLHADSGSPAATALVEAPRFEQARPKNPNALRHKVRDGDTLPSLAEVYYGDADRYAAIFEANRAVLSSPDVLTIGTYLVIPSAEEAAATTAAAAANPPPAARLLPRVQIRPLGE
jgi:phage tail protein X